MKREDESLWRPMENAPHDGTEVILGFGFGVAQSAVWNPAYGGWVLIGDDHPQVRCEPLGWIPMPHEEVA